MFCDRCGAQLQDSAAFCPSCGRRMGPGPLIPARSRIAGHVRLLGILWLALSVFRLLPGLGLWFFFNPVHAFFPGMPMFVNGIIRGFAFFMLAGGVVGIVAGWGLLERKPWARMLAIVLGFLNLLDMPFGTALGIYTLWVLLPAQSEEEYRAVSEGQ
jgi:hypothetical protein